MRPAVLTDEVGGIRVHAIEVARAFNNDEFLLSEVWETIAEHFLEVFGVFAEVDGIGEPADGGVEGVLGSLDI